MGKARAWLLYALAWVPIAVLYAAALAQEMPPGRAVQGAIVSVAVAALLGVGVWHLSDRVPWRSDRALGFLAFHVLLGIGFVGLWIAAVYARLWVVGGVDLVRLVAVEEGGWTAVVGFWIYGLLVGGSHAVRAERRARIEREAAARSEALASRAEAERARVELHALRSRLQPHFLFNTLHGIRALVLRDPAKAADAIETLGGLLRFILDLEGRESDLVSVREELEFTRAYVELERNRLGDRLAVEESIDEDALDARIPALTLQPLIENAIRHGIAPRARGGTVRIAVRRSGAALEVVVEDDGIGPAEGAIESAGIGLRTVRNRIETRYDGAGRFSFSGSPGHGFRVALGFPADPEGP
ncbi:MAG TPA: histidine kinase [Gemmatimonadota bacterium]|nr:histidine kinase [Gemmatimonadota bacterium]